MNVQLVAEVCCIVYASLVPRFELGGMMLVCMHGKSFFSVT